MDVSEGLASRPNGERRWNIWRAAVALFYLASGVLNLAYTLPNSDDPEIFEGYADGAWFGFLGDLVRDVFVPSATLWMSLVIAFEVVVAALIANRGTRVDVGVALSVVWVVAILPFLAWPYLLVNIVLAIGQGVLLRRSYDRSLWRVAWAKNGSSGRTAAVGS